MYLCIPYNLLINLQQLVFVKMSQLCSDFMNLFRNVWIFSGK